MRTQIIKLNAPGWRSEVLAEAARVVRGGGVIVFPTDTVYGLGGDGNRREVVERIYEIKKRRADKPLIRLIASLDEVESCLRNPDHRRVAEKFWPGPLTLILTLSDGSRRGFRFPGHDFLCRLIGEIGVEMVATSANPSGHSEITDGTVARRDFSGKVDLIIDGGEVSGRPSTVLDLTVSPERILREGPITREQIEACLGHRIE
ncbi:MAG: L-threonylcarbamoyladenylate synthase [Candidatus Euphemobacter frigidus]|nr:L-threonylcarbamoyladenylate synthase [Candidatus Euphemobacter frigidus]MDP8276523.1 L-threonylcarbamoyladenylate synthase [Candidatus Euphemobacter frigidus]